MFIFDFRRYLSAKRTVDDRAINRYVWEGLVQVVNELQASKEIEILEVGAGIGTMAHRLVEWGAFWRGKYLGIDAEGENISTALSQLPAWGASQNLLVEQETPSGYHFTSGKHGLQMTFIQADVFDFIQKNTNGPGWDLLTAHAFLDLFDLRQLLPGLTSLVRPGGFLYLTLNFDGETIFEPVWDRELENRLIMLYHQSMDERIVAGRISGDSRAGRHLFTLLEQNQLEILRAGASDWVVYPQKGIYAADEAYFLQHILHFFETSLAGRSEIEPERLANWIARRREQIARGELVYIAHQTDFLVSRLF